MKQITKKDVLKTEHVSVFAAHSSAWESNVFTKRFTIHTMVQDLPNQWIEVMACLTNVITGVSTIQKEKFWFKDLDNAVDRYNETTYETTKAISDH